MVAEQSEQEKEAARLAEKMTAHVVREAEETAARFAREAEEAAAQAAVLDEEAADHAPKKRKGRWLLVGIAAYATALVVWHITPAVYDYANAVYDYANLKYLKLNDPEGYQRVLAEREEASEKRRLEEIQELEARVWRVPVSSYGEKIRLYKRLQALNPGVDRYDSQLSYFEEQKRFYDDYIEKRRLESQRDVASTEAQEEAVKRRKGFHCLSRWDGSNLAVAAYVKKNMREPDSFEHIETRIGPADTNGDHVLLMKYRARNGFGGMTAGLAVATVRNSDCTATVLSIE